jgi:hypothetical protein
LFAIQVCIAEKGDTAMKKLLIVVVTLAILLVAGKYINDQFMRKTTVRVMEVHRYYSGGSFDELVAVVKNTGEAKATIRGYEVYGRAAEKGFGRRWNRESGRDIQVRIEPGQTQSITLDSQSIPTTALSFRVKLYVTSHTGATYTIMWNSDAD